jgi:hypothetical protein
MKGILAWILCPFFSLFAYEIIETANFRAITQHVTPNTLVLLDIDDTLLIPKQTLGTDVWFRYQLKKNAHLADCLDKTLAQWEAIRHLTEIEIVEKGTEEIIRQMQEAKIAVMGLTTQGLALATRTVKQLQSINIDLSLTAPTRQDHYFINDHGVLMRQGILFTAGTPKGPAIAKLLQILGYQPERILFINDKETHLLDVAVTAEEIGISFIGLRYSFRDGIIANFSPLIAEIQYNESSFNKILSDEEALEKLHSLNRIQP